MTDILPTLIAVLLAVRIVLQLKQGERAFEKMYCAPSEVENMYISVDEHCVDTTIRDYGKRGYELVQVIDRHGGYGCNRYQLFFTRKKIKNYYEK